MNKKIYACYSPSHRPLLERHFLPSIPDGFDVVLRRFDQVCPTGEYKSTNWESAVKAKILFILEAIGRERDPFVFSDVDVRFYDFRPEHLVEAMSGDWDVLCQADALSSCTGFMFVRPGKMTTDLFEETMAHVDECNDDQDSFNKFALPTLWNTDLRSARLPLERYWNIGPKWNGMMPPEGIAMHHANWVVGVGRKLELLDLVFDDFQKRRG